MSGDARATFDANEHEQRELTPQQHLEAVKRDCDTLAATLREAQDAGVSPALILPQLVLAFRESFGEMPAGFKLPGLPVPS